MLQDPQSPEVTHVQRLRNRSYRQDHQQVIAEGYPEVSRAVKAGVPISALYICPDIFCPDDREFHHLPIREVSREVFAAMAFGSRLKGILAVCHPVACAARDLLKNHADLIIILEAVEKPGNLGAVLRTADGAGVDGVLVCDGRTDIYNQHVVRASIGAVFTVPVADAGKADAYEYLVEMGFRIYAASAHASTVYTQADFSSKTAIVVGNEHAGVSDFWMKHSHQQLRIPMAGQVTSLNVTVSASILVYEARRQKSLGKLSI